MDAPDLLRSLVQSDLGLPRECHVELITHEVGINWRERHDSPEERVGAIEESLVHVGPFSGTLVRIDELDARLPIEISQADRRGEALSVTSRVWSGDRELIGHLGLMNLHPEGFGDTAHLARAVTTVVGGMAGYLLRSGRHFHYYGRRLLSEHEWLAFLGQFLMPCTMVSPRYVGHSIARRFCSLRLNAVPPYKGIVPTVVLAI